MKIVVINGNSRHGSTWNCAELIKNEISQQVETEVTEFMLPRDMPHFCRGCFSCFMNGEHTCPHSESIAPIVKAIIEADLIVLTSPVYGFDVTGAMKALLDHLCYIWMSHRPEPAMFNKMGLVIVTTAGAGMSHTAKTLKNSLKFWGVKRVFSFTQAVSAMKWKDVTDKKLHKINKQAKSMARKIVRTSNKINKISAPVFTKFFFSIMAGMHKNNTWNKHDRDHWEKLGWLKGEKPF